CSKTCSSIVSKEIKRIAISVGIANPSDSDVCQRELSLSPNLRQRDFDISRRDLLPMSVAVLQPHSLVSAKAIPSTSAGQAALQYGQQLCDDSTGLARIGRSMGARLK